MSADYDFRAKLQLSLKPTLSASGLRCAIQFDGYPEYATSAQLGLREAKEDGRNAGTPVSILAQEYFADRLFAGQNFVVLQGQSPIGSGIVLDVVNDRLRRSSDPQAIADLDLNTYPPDVRRHIDRNFEHLAPLAVRELQIMLAQTPSARHPRIVRALLQLAAGSTHALGDAIDLAQIDYRDVLLQAEYERGDDGKLARVRDLSQPFA